MTAATPTKVRPQRTRCSHEPVANTATWDAAGIEQQYQDDSSEANQAMVWCARYLQWLRDQISEHTQNVTAPTDIAQSRKSDLIYTTDMAHREFTRAQKLNNETAQQQLAMLQTMMRRMTEQALQLEYATHAAHMARIPTTDTNDAASTRTIYEAASRASLIATNSKEWSVTIHNPKFIEEWQRLAAAHLRTWCDILRTRLADTTANFLKWTAADSVRQAREWLVQTGAEEENTDAIERLLEQVPKYYLATAPNGNHEK